MNTFTESSEHKRILPYLPMIAFRKSKNIMDLIINAKLKWNSKANSITTILHSITKKKDKDMKLSVLISSITNSTIHCPTAVRGGGYYLCLVFTQSNITMDKHTQCQSQSVNVGRSDHFFDSTHHWHIIYQIKALA